jgi:8-oxo-dGTP pyrophosphatase MutT (NUDIX family)
MTQPATPLPASTVVLMRPCDNGRFEVYLNRRPDQMDTYAGVYVFPGGRVDTNDYSSEMVGLTRGMTPTEAQQKLQCDLQPELCLAYWVAAARELFEEAGIHFFVPDGGLALKVPPDELSLRLASKRVALQQGTLNLPNLLLSEGLCCDLGQLRYFFHRVTPEHYPVRFDTRFYLAVLPPNQIPLRVSEEVSESLWITPRAALDSAEHGDFRMMPPTLAVLRMLNGYHSWAGVCAAFDLAAR